MRILLLGHTGLLGSQLLRTLSLKHHVSMLPREIWDARMSENDALLHRTMQEFAPDIVINCIGIVKARCLDPIEAVEVNALLPHKLAWLAKQYGAKLLHISTDCVFSGEAGSYSEQAIPDPTDLYGKSKLLGEVHGEHCMTLRTSFIGRHPRGGQGLVDWLLGKSGTVNGFVYARYSGLTTIELARVIDLIITERWRSGTWHVGGHNISKYELLTLLKQHYRLSVSIEPETEFYCDRTLNSWNFYHMANYSPPWWGDMIAELAKEYPL